MKKTITKIMKKSFLYVLIVLGLAFAYASPAKYITQPLNWITHIFTAEKITDADLPTSKVKIVRTIFRSDDGSVEYGETHTETGTVPAKIFSARIDTRFDFTELGENINDGDRLFFPFSAEMPVSSVSNSRNRNIQFLGGTGVTVGTYNATTKGVEIIFNAEAKEEFKRVLAKRPTVLNESFNIFWVEVPLEGQKNTKIVALDGKELSVFYDAPAKKTIQATPDMWQALGSIPNQNNALYTPNIELPVKGNDANEGIFDFYGNVVIPRDIAKTLHAGDEIVFKIPSPVTLVSGGATSTGAGVKTDVANGTITLVMGQNGTDADMTLLSRWKMKLPPMQEHQISTITHPDGKTTQQVYYQSNVPQDLSSKVKYINQLVDVANVGRKTETNFNITGQNATENIAFKFLGSFDLSALNYNFKEGDYFTFPIPEPITLTKESFSLGYKGASLTVVPFKLDIDPVTRTGKVTVTNEFSRFQRGLLLNANIPEIIDYSFSGVLPNMQSGVTKIITHPGGTTQNVTYVIGGRNLGVTNFTNYKLKSSFGEFPSTYKDLPFTREKCEETTEEELTNFLYLGDFNLNPYVRNLKVGDYFEIPLPENLEAVESSSIPIAGRSGEVIASMDVRKQDRKAIVTITNVPAENELDKLQGTFSVPVTIPIPIQNNKEGSVQVPYFDGNTQTITLTLICNDNNPNTGKIVNDILNKYKYDLTNTNKKEYRVFINRIGKDLGSEYTIIRDKITSSKGVVITASNFALWQVNFNNKTPEIKYNEFQPADIVNTLQIVQDEAVFRANPTNKAYLKLLEGGQAFELHLGENVGTKQYYLIYEVNDPKDGSTVRNEISIEQNGQKLPPYETKHGKPPVDNVVTEEFIAQLPPGVSLDVELRSRIRIFKYDDQTNARLKGAVFRVENTRNGYNKTFTTNEQGEVLTEPLLADTYTVTEITAPAGYVKDDTPKTIEVTNGQGNSILVNSPNAKAISHNVEVRWEGSATSHPNVEITLQKSTDNGANFSNTNSVVTLPNGTTTTSFAGLNPNQSVYRAIQSPVAGYATTYDYSQPGKTIIINKETIKPVATDKTFYVFDVQNWNSISIKEDQPAGVTVNNYVVTEGSNGRLTITNTNFTPNANGVFSDKSLWSATPGVQGYIKYYVQDTQGRQSDVATITVHTLNLTSSYIEKPSLERVTLNEIINNVKINFGGKEVPPGEITKIEVLNQAETTVYKTDAELPDPPTFTTSEGVKEIPFKVRYTNKLGQIKTLNVKVRYLSQSVKNEPSMRCFTIYLNTTTKEQPTREITSEEIIQQGFLNFNQLPQGTLVRWKNANAPAQVNRNSVAAVEDIMEVVYPDGSIDERKPCIGFYDNVKPEVVVPSNQEVGLNTPVSISGISATDNITANPTITVTGLPPGLTYSNGVISGTPTRSGTFTVRVLASDERSNSDWKDFTIKVTTQSEQANPKIKSIEVRLSTITTGTSRELSKEEAKSAISNASDLPNGTDFRWVGTPQIQINSVTPLVQRQVNMTFPDGSSKTIIGVVVVPIDDVKPVVSVPANTTVTANEAIATITGISATDNVTANPTITVTGLEGSGLTYSNGQITGTPTGRPGTEYRVNVVSRDEAGNVSETKTFTITVSGQNTKYTPEKQSQTILLSSVPVNGIRDLTGAEAKLGVLNPNNLPNGTVYSWEGSPKANHNSTSAITNGTIVVTYPDGSVDRITGVVVNFRDDVKPVVSNIENRVFTTARPIEMKVPVTDNIANNITQCNNGNVKGETLVACEKVEVTGLPNGLSYYFKNGEIIIVGKTGKLGNFPIEVRATDNFNNTSEPKRFIITIRGVGFLNPMLRFKTQN